MAEEKTTTGTDTKAAAPAAGTGAGEGVVKKVKRGKKNVSTGNVYVLSTFNNTIVTITDAMGNTVCWSTAGAKGFRGSRQKYAVCRAGGR